MPIVCDVLRATARSGSIALLSQNNNPASTDPTIIKYDKIGIRISSDAIHCTGVGDTGAKFGYALLYTGECSLSKRDGYLYKGLRPERWPSSGEAQLPPAGARFDVFATRKISEECCKFDNFQFSLA